MIILFFLFRGNALDSVNDTPSNDEDEHEMFKRSPWPRKRRRRRRRSRRRRFHIRIRARRIIQRVCKYGRFIPHVGTYIVYTVSNNITVLEVSTRRTDTPN